MAEKLTNAFETTLSAAITTTGQTSISVSTAAPTDLQGGSFRIRIDTELLLVTATGASGASPWTVTRGVEGTVAATHANGAAVRHVLTKAGLETWASETLADQSELQAHLDDTVDAHDASAISYAGGTGISATNVEAAIDELATEKADVTAQKTFRTGHTWAVSGALTAAQEIPSFFVPKATGQTITLISVRARIRTGTSIVVQLQRNGTNHGTASTVTPTATTFDLADVALAADDEIDIVLSSPVGSPVDLTYTVYLEHQV